MRTKLGWIRDCWSLLVTYLSSRVTSKGLFDDFWEAGPVFNVFLPKDRPSGRSRGSGFVRFKTDWDANRAIQRLEGRVIDGSRIGVQMARYQDHNQKKAFHSSVYTDKKQVFKPVDQGD